MTGKENKSDEYLEWFRKAEEDELAGKDILNAGHVYAPACFHFQQMVEKYLKGFLVFLNKRPPKVHVLLTLETLLNEIEPDIKQYDKELDLLGNLYVETCYPGDYPEFTLRETHEALMAAIKIKDFVLERVRLKMGSEETE
ncbi:MAG: HEPN domain-containing protein [Nitrospirae bacterium]|nr:HEPN domain-containing protein [Nitrospirota bacterium]